MLAVLGGALVWTARTVHAQAPNQSEGESGSSSTLGRPYRGAVVKQDDFPTVTVEFPCIEPLGKYLVLENGVAVTMTTPVTRPTSVPARIAVVLDLFNDEDAPAAAFDAATAAVISASNVLTRLASPAPFVRPAPKVAVFLPSSEGLPAAIVTPTWSSTPAELSAAVTALLDRSPATRFPAVIESTTAIYQILEKLIREDLPANAAERQVILLFSDGTDKVSTQASFDRLVGLALGRGIPIHTVYIPTAAPPDLRLESLAAGTGGTFLANAGDAVTLTNLLAPIWETQLTCRITYVAQVSPPTVVEIAQRRGGRPVNVATAYLPASLKLPAPLVVIESPQAGDEFTATYEATLPVTVAWQLEGGAWRWVNELAVAVQQVNTGLTVTPLAAVLTHPFTAVSPFVTQFRLADLPEDSYQVRVTITDNFGMVASDGRYVRVRTLPAPTPTPAPQTSSEKVQDALNDLESWLSTDPMLRWPLLYGLVLLLSVLLFLLLWWLLHRPPQPPTPKPSPLGPAFALLVREQRGDPRLQSRQMMHLYAGDSTLNLPETLLEPMQQRLNPAELVHFNSAYSAYITCSKDSATGAYRASIHRDPPLDAKKQSGVFVRPIEITVADAVASFVLPDGPKGTYELHDGDQIRFGDLTYRYTLLTAHSLPPATEQGAPGSGSSPGDQGPAARNGAGGDD
jgi:hypothetical protein